MAVKIIYQDGADWIPLSGIDIQYFGSSRELNLTSRVIPHLAAPVSIFDQWNGVDIKVQEKRFDAYTIHFAAKEDQLNEISRIRSCDSINIVDIANGIDHIADNTTVEGFAISEPEKIINTTNYLIKITYRINKTVIDKVKVRTNVVTLVGSGTYYSKFDKLTYLAQNVNVEVDWYDGTKKTLRETRDQGFSVVLYFNDSDLRTFLDDYGQNTFTIDTVPVVTKMPAEVSPIGHDFSKVVVHLVTATIRDTDLSVTKILQSNNIQIDTVNNYYTDYAIEAQYEDTEQSFSDNEQGYGVLDNAITRFVSKVKFYMNDTELADFKNRFETSQSITVNAIPVLTNRLVEVNKLDYNINEVIATCLTSTNVLYPQQ